MAAISDLYFFSMKGIPYIKNIVQFTFTTISRLHIAPPPLTSATNLHGDFVMVVKCNPDSTAVWSAISDIDIYTCVYMIFKFQQSNNILHNNKH
jgi:hypothetical protein